MYGLETHKAIFRWVIKVLVEEGLIRGLTISIEAKTLEVHAAMQSIVRWEDGQSYEEYVQGLAQAAGMDPTREQLTPRPPSVLI